MWKQHYFQNFCSFSLNPNKYKISQRSTFAYYKCTLQQICALSGFDIRVCFFVDADRSYRSLIFHFGATLLQAVVSTSDQSHRVCWRSDKIKLRTHTDRHTPGRFWVSKLPLLQVWYFPAHIYHSATFNGLNESKVERHQGLNTMEGNNWCALFSTSNLTFLWRNCRR